MGRGDQDSDTTYIGVGRALSFWEQVEFWFAVLYSVFVARPWSLHSIREYGVPRIFLADGAIYEKSDFTHKGRVL
jgi:hypothetical protein